MGGGLREGAVVMIDCLLWLLLAGGLVAGGRTGDLACIRHLFANEAYMSDSFEQLTMLVDDEA